MMKKTTITLCIAIAAIGMTACSEKKKSDNIITHKEVKKEPAAPIKMQDCGGKTARKGVTFGKSFENVFRKRYRKIGIFASNTDLTNVCP